MKSAKRKTWVGQSLLSLESLEARSLLSGIHGAAVSHVSDHHPAIVSNSAPKSTAAAAKASSTSSETHLAANLSDASGSSKVFGTAKYESEIKKGVAVRELSVEVKNATAGVVIQVTTTDAKGSVVSLGAITVKSDGSGKLKLTTKSPNILAGSTISLTTTDAAGNPTTLASGIFSTPTKTPGMGHDSSDAHSETKLVAMLADPVGKLSGLARYESETEHGLVIRELSVLLTGGTPGNIIDVSISLDGTSPATSLGRITIGADGVGRLKLNRTSPAVTPTSILTLSTVSTASDGSISLSPITNATFTIPAK